jgi:hypothetical protein
VPTLLRQLHGAFPALRWTLHESGPDVQFDALCGGEIDVGIWRGNPIDTEQLWQHRLCQQLYGREDTALALPLGHRLARRNSVGLADLADETLLDLSMAAASLPTLIGDGGQRQRPGPGARLGDQHRVPQRGRAQPARRAPHQSVPGAQHRFPIQWHPAIS